MTVWTEWDPLEEVVVGDCNPTYPGVPELDKILSETKEDLDNLANYLSKLGIRVHRPTIGDLQPNQVYPIVPRDQYLVYGDCIYQTYTSMQDRYWDGLCYYDIFAQLFMQGHNWLSQPPPVLEQLPYQMAATPYHHEYKNKLLWHTATMFKAGDSLIVNDYGPGNQNGLDWMERNCEGTLVKNVDTKQDRWGHIDQGFYMTDDDTVFCVDISWVPQCLRNKKIIELNNRTFNYTDSLKDIQQGNKKNLFTWLEQWQGLAQDTAFESNVLVVDSKNIVSSIELPEVEAHGITVHHVPIRHGMFWEAGVHCLTLDVRRNGSKRRVV